MADCLYCEIKRLCNRSVSIGVVVAPDGEYWQAAAIDIDLIGSGDSLCGAIDHLRDKIEDYYERLKGKVLQGEPINPDPADDKAAEYYAREYEYLKAVIEGR